MKVPEDLWGVEARGLPVPPFAQLAPGGAWETQHPKHSKPSRCIAST